MKHILIILILLSNSIWVYRYFNGQKTTIANEFKNQNRDIQELKNRLDNQKELTELYAYQLNEVGQLLTNENNNLKDRVEELEKEIKKLKRFQNQIKNNNYSIDNSQIEASVSQTCPNPNPNPNKESIEANKEVITQSNQGKYLLSPILGYGTIGASFKYENGLYQTIPKNGVYYGFRGDYFLKDNQTIGVQLNSNESFSLNYGFLFSWP